MHSLFQPPVRRVFATVVCIALASTLLACSATPPAAVQPRVAPSTGAWQYPPTRTVDHVDTYHGTTVADPYRWLEDDRSAETAAWVAAQNRVTDDYFSRLPARSALQQRLAALWNHAREGVPVQRAGWLYFSANSGLQNQAVWMRRPVAGGPAEVVLDPNTFSADGTTRLGVFSIAPSGRHAVYALSTGGSDWLNYRVLDLQTLQPLADDLRWVKVSGVAWAGDGFFYSRYPAPPEGRALSAVNERHQVFFHRLGTAQADDRLVYENPDHPQRFHTVSTTSDGRFAVLSISDRGRGQRGNALWVRDLKGPPDAAFRPLAPANGAVGDDSFVLVDSLPDGRIAVRTLRGAPNGRVVAIHPLHNAKADWTTLVPQRDEALRGATRVGNRLFITTLKDVSSRVYVHRLDGRLLQALPLPGLGTVAGFDGGEADTTAYFSYTSFDQPTSIYRVGLDGGVPELLTTPNIPGYTPGQFTTRQVFFTSRDGTRVPMFLVHRRGLKMDGQRPTLLFGYGGFNVSQLPGFSASRLALLEQGFVFALANIRGGGEYGQAWHRAGTKLNKQNTFDDFIAAAEWLQREGVTRRDRLAVQGGSNGGLLVGAVINQRPELFRAAVPQVGVMDMLRFQKFTIGWNWVADYGSSDNAEEFAVLRAYSPLHNLRPGALYPATLVTTADHDDRVVPAHSFKYAAALQATVSKQRPALIRVQTASGHGASNTAKLIEGTAEVYAFLLHELGVAWTDPALLPPVPPDMPAAPAAPATNPAP